MSQEKPIEGFENLYTINTNGQVFSLRNNIYLRPNKDRDGYFIYHLSFKGKRKVFKAHRLVAIYFIENLLNYKEVNHIDGDKTNNTISNLEWADDSIQMKHSSENNLCAKGERIKQSKLKSKDVIQIRKLRKDKNYTYYKLASLFIVSYQLIHLICKNKIWRHV